MRKVALSTQLVLLAVGAFAQGLVRFDNIDGTDPSPTATTNGLIWRQSGAGFPLLETAPNLYGTLLGGISPGTLAVLNADLAGSPDSSRVLLDYNVVPGQYVTDTGDFYSVAGVPGGSVAYFQVQLWEGTAVSYAAAVAAGDYAGESTVFSQRIAGGTGLPPSLYGMPAVVLTIPEPDMFALAGLGAAMLLILGRKLPRHDPWRRWA